MKQRSGKDVLETESLLFVTMFGFECHSQCGGLICTLLCSSRIGDKLSATTQTYSPWPYVNQRLPAVSSIPLYFGNILYLASDNAEHVFLILSLCADIV